MRARTSFSRGLALSVALSAVAAAGAGAIRTVELSRIRAERLSHGARASELEERVAGLSAFDEAGLKSLVEEERRFDSKLGPADAWERLLGLMGERWSVETSTRERHEGFTTILGSLRMTKAAAGDWSAILAAVERAARLPGVALESIELATAGPEAQGGFSLVRVGVSVRLKNG